MNARVLLELLLDYLIDGRGSDEPVLVAFEGRVRTIERVETRPMPNGQPRPKPTFVLIVADGEADV
jgi:hypothetical protein